MYLFVLCVACLTVFHQTIHSVFGCVAILLLNIMDVFSVGRGALLDRPCMVFERMCDCACCSCDPSVYLSVPSIGFVYVFVCRKLSPHLRV